MKSFTLGFNIVLVVAIAVLFYLHFSSSKAQPPKAELQMPSGSFRIAYFEMDSIESHYDYLKKVRADIRALEQTKTNELAGLRNDYNKALQQYQQKGNTMNQEDVAKANEDMMQRESNLKSQEQIKGQEMQNESVNLIQDVKKRIDDFLKSYNKDKRFAYIFASSPDIIYYKDSAYDITADLIKGLNEDYKKKK
jgi:outer membrane protein